MADDVTKEELLAEARQEGIPGRSSMTKDELEEALASGPPADRSKGLREPNGNWFHDRLLSITLASLFLVSWIGQLYFQYQHEADQALQHGEQAPALFSGEFWNSFLAATLENWQSEFLQLFSFVVLATFLIHRDSPQSRDGDDEMTADIKAIRAKLGA